MNEKIERTHDKDNEPVVSTARGGGHFLTLRKLSR